MTTLLLPRAITMIQNMLILVMMLDFVLLVRSTDLFFRTDHICFAEDVTVKREKVVLDYTQNLKGAQEAKDTTIAVTHRATRNTLKAFVAQGREGHASFQAEVEGIYDICFSRKRAGDVIDLSVTIHVQFDERRIQEPNAHIVSNRKHVPVLHASSMTGISGLDEKESGGAHSKGLMDVISYVDVDGEIKETLRSHAYLVEVENTLKTIRAELFSVEAVNDAFLTRHSRFQKTSESSYQRLFWFSISSFCLVVLLSCYQYYDMRAFLLKKKIV